MNLSFSHAGSTPQGGEYRKKSQRSAKCVGTLEDALFERLDVRLSESESTRRNLNAFLRVNCSALKAKIWRH